ncbi:MAG: NINE protein [Muribaculaceae bacterium]|nr:NINE protein [Muribaculaceae bacterium]
MAIDNKCPRCGNITTTQSAVSYIKCPYCGNEFQPMQGPQFGQQGYQQYGNQQQGYQRPNYAYQQSSNDIFANGPSGKSRGVAGLLAIFLGSLGIHYFYIEKSTAGIVFLLVSLIGGILTCGILAGVVGIVALIQGILMMTMSQQEFENKYVTTPDQFPLF